MDLRRWRLHLRLRLQLLDMRSFPNSTCQRQICLFVCLYKPLQSIHILLVRRCRHSGRGSSFANLVKRPRHLMVRTPDTRSSNSRLVSHSHDSTADGIPSRTLDRRQVKSKPVLCLECTTNVEMRIAAAVVAWHARTLVRLANLAYFAVPVWRNESKAFGRFQFGSLSELDLGSPHGAHHMDPVVAHRAFQGFAGSNRFGHGLLTLSVQFDRFLHHLLLQPFFLTVPVRLFLMRDLGRFHQLVLRPRHRAKDTFVACRDHRAAVVRTHVT